MSRPRKCRRVCCLPEIIEFTPVSGASKSEVVLSVDEYETIRLIDKEGLSQEECGVQMDVARTTIQQIYTSARRKIAEALVEGHTLKIMGGEYRLCEADEHKKICGKCCNCRRCEETKLVEQTE